VDSSNLFKREAFEQVVVTLVPGFIVVFPYSFVLWSYFPCLGLVWQSNSLILSIIGFILAIAIGLILETFGGWIESHVWDKIIQRFIDREHLMQWEKYLQLSMNPEPIGQHYLRTKVMFMKFDLGISLAIVIGWIGFAWLQTLKKFITTLSFCLLSLILLLLVIYLLWDSYQCAKILNKVRRLLIEVKNEK